MKQKLTEKLINDWILANATPQSPSPEGRQGMDVARQKQLRQVMMGRAKEVTKKGE